jgi:hypothetical protein
MSGTRRARFHYLAFGGVQVLEFAFFLVHLIIVFVDVIYLPTTYVLARSNTGFSYLELLW